MRWPGRRWAFSLRTLLVLIAALCGWLGWERSVVERRKAARMQHAERYLFVTIAPEEVRGVELATIPRLRGWLFGDEPVQAIMLPMLAFAALYFRYYKCDRRLAPGVAWDVCLWVTSAGMFVAAATMLRGGDV